MANITPAAVAAYINEHPGCDTAELERHFGCSDGYLRKMKRAARQAGLLPNNGAAESAAAAGPAAAGGDSAAAAPAADRVPRGRVIVGAPGGQLVRAVKRDRGVLVPGLVARPGTMWFCHLCDQLMPAIAGTKSADWNATGCPMHAPAGDQDELNDLQQDQLAADPAVAPVPPVPVAAEAGVVGSGAGTMAAGADFSPVPVPVEASVPLVDDHQIGVEALAAGAGIDARTSVKDNARPAPAGWPGLVPLVVEVVGSLLGSSSPQVLIGLALAVGFIVWSVLQLSGFNPWLH